MGYEGGLGFRWTHSARDLPLSCFVDPKLSVKLLDDDTTGVLSDVYDANPQLMTETPKKVTCKSNMESSGLMITQGNREVRENIHPGIFPGTGNGSVHSGRFSVPSRGLQSDIGAIGFHHLRWSLCCFWLLCLALTIDAQAGFEHPGLLHSRDDLEFIRVKVASGEEPWKGAWENLLDRRSSSLNFKPEPTIYVVRGAYGRGSVGDKDLSSSADAAYSHALQWIVTEDKAHALKTIEILNAWAPVIRDFEGNDAKLLAGWTGHKFCNAAEIIRYTDAGWANEDIEQFERMLLTVYVPLIREFFPEANGNWDAAMINTMLCIGVFCEKEDLFTLAVDHYIRGTGNGGITRYIYPSGQCEESTRDQTHTQLGLGEFAEACQVAWQQGVDLYGVAENRLALGIEYTAKYLLGESVHCYGKISEVGRGRFRDIYEGVYHHYRTEKGLSLPYTKRALDRSRSGSRSRSWGALNAGHGSGYERFERDLTILSPSTIANETGAQVGATTEIPENAVTVEVGESIQDKLDARAGSGSWVVLGKGTHQLKKALLMPSGVTLAGFGLESILFLDPEEEGAAIVSKEAALHDVVFRDFVVEGGLAVRLARDPNQDRRMRSYQMAPSRAGILLSDSTSGHMERLRFEHVTVRHCTHNGVAIRGADDVIVRACDFSDNGSSVVPGPGQQHNLLLAQVVNCRISDSRLDDSPWGSGLNLMHCSEIRIVRNEVARNARQGIRCSESRNIHIEGNLLEGNDGFGLLSDVVLDGTRGLEVVNNLVRNNGRGGIYVYRTGRTILENNRLRDNGTFE